VFSAKALGASKTERRIPSLNRALRATAGSAVSLTSGLDPRQSDPLLVLVSGLPGVGKSTLVGELASRLDAAVISRDAARLSLPSQGFRRLVELLVWRLAQRRLAATQRRAGLIVTTTTAEHLQNGRSVIVEAVADQELRERIREVAAAHHARLIEVECALSDRTEHHRRLSMRAEGERFWRRLLVKLEAGYAPPADCVRLDTRAAPEQLADRVLTHIDSGGPGLASSLP
jgi:predicted kinase